jgi:hypothetical protein
MASISCRIAFEVLRPFPGDAVELELCILEGDIGIKPRSGCRDVVARHILQRRVGVILAPHIEENRLYVGSLLNGLDISHVIAIGSGMRHGRWKRRRMLLGEMFEEHHKNILAG